MNMGKIRVLRDGANNGPWNMAVDEAIFLSVMDGDSPPTLRFYAWNPVCLSIGYFQKINTINIVECRKSNVDLVRRPTGGRAVLHYDEITYSITIPVPGGKEGSITDTYKSLNTGILKGLKKFGINGNFHRRQSGKIRKSPGSPSCFNSPSLYEILVDGKKLLGSAQVRRNGYLLQHGSIPVNIDRNLINSLLISDNSLNIRTQVFDSYTTIYELIDPLPEREIIIDSIIDGFKETLDAKFIFDASITDEEIKKSDKLFNEKYSNDAWNLSR